ncbi:ribonuclease H-like domain-containing protein [Tanacetum coccineum]
MQKESVSKQGRKPAKAEPTVHKDLAFDDLDDIMDDAMDYMESEDAQDEGRTSSVPDKGTDKSKVSTDKTEVSTAKPKEVEVSTDKLDEGTAEPKDGTSDESTAPAMVFRDDETIAEFLVSMSQNKTKQKGVEIKDAEDSDRPRATSTRSVLTLKPLPKVDPKDKGKKVLEEEGKSDAESEGVDEAERKFDKLAKDEEIARKVQEDWEAKEEMKKLAEKEATKASLIQDFNDIQARIEADRLLAARLQEFKKSKLKKHEVKQVEQSCLGEDCWELFGVELSILATTLNRLERSTLIGIYKWYQSWLRSFVYEEHIFYTQDLFVEEEMAYSSSSSNANSKVEAQLVAHQKNQLCQLSANDKAGFGHDGAKESKVSETITSVSKVETGNSETSNDKVEMTKIKTIRQAENPRKNNKSPRGNKRNWNGMMTQKLGEDFKFNNKACYLWFCVWRQQFVFMVLFIDVSNRVSIDNDCPAKIGIYQGGKFAWHYEWNMLFDVGSNYKSYSLSQPTKAIKKEEKLFVHESARTVKHKEVSTVGAKIKELVLLFVVYTANACIFTMYHDKELASPEKTASELAIPGQTTTGKESLNPFMAGSLPKTIHFCDSLQKFKNHLSDDKESLGKDASKQGRIDDAEAEVTVIDETSNDARKKNNKISNKILKKFDFASVKTASTPIETQKPLVKDEEAIDVDSVLAQGFRVSSFDLEAYSDSDYAGENLDKKSTKGGCQFLGRRLIPWQCKKQTIVATSTTEAEYIAAANCYGQVLWIQNQIIQCFTPKQSIMELDTTSLPLAHTDYPIWEVIQKGNGSVSVSTATHGVIKVLPPKTAEEILARERERKARTTLLMALPEDHLAKFHKITDAKEMWEAIKSRFGGNDEPKKMQNQLEIHGAGVTTEDANQKFLRSLPSAWSQVSLIMRTKPGIDTLSFDDLYNNLRVFESDVKGSTASSSGTQNMAFVSENTSSTNEASTAYGASSSSGHKPQREGSSSYANDLIFSFFTNQSSGPQLDHKDLEQIDEFDLEEIDLKWQVAMISMRIKKFYKKTGRRLHFDAKELVGFNKSKLECYNYHKKGHFAKEYRSKGNQESRRRDAWNSGYKAKDNGTRPGKQEETKALVTLDGDGVDWTNHSEDEQDNHAFMAYSSSGSDTEVTSCLIDCKESYVKIKKIYDEQREQLSDAVIEIKAYTQSLKKVEAQLVAHQQNQHWYEEKIRFMKIDLDDKTDVPTYHKKLLAEAEKEKEELTAKVEKWHNFFKNLNILLKSQMSARDKAGLGYGDQMNKDVLSYENEVFGSLFNCRFSDTEDSPVNNRYAEGMHTVPLPMTGIYIPSGPDKEIDDS